MSLKSSLVPAFHVVERRPGLLVVGVAVGFLQTGLWTAISAFVGVGDPALRLLWPLLAFALVSLTVPLYAGIYVPITEPPVDVRRTLQKAATAIRRHYGSLFATDVLASFVAVVLAFGAVLVWLVGSTVVRYGRYALANPAAPYAMESAYLGFGALFLGLGVGLLGVRFAGVLVLFEGASPRRAWRPSLRFARRRPLSLLGFGVVVALLYSGPGLAGRLVAESASGERVAVLVSVVVTAVLGGVGLTLAAALHVVYFDRTVAPTVAVRSPARSKEVRWLRIAAVAVVLTATVGGAVAVRVEDVRPADRDRAALPDDPRDAYVVAASNTVGSSHRRVSLMKNTSESNATFHILSRTGVDYRDRQAYVYFVERDSGRVFGGYYGEGTMALRNTGGRWSGFFSRQTDNWSVGSLPGYGVARPQGSFSSSVPGPKVNWTTVDANASTLRFRVEEPTAIRAALAPESYAGLGGNMTNDSHLTAFVDRERAVITRVVFHLHSRDTGKDVSYVVRFGSVGTADLQRPEPIGPREPLEWVWDACYY